MLCFHINPPPLSLPQDNLSLLGRNPDKEMRTHTGRKLYSPTGSAATSAVDMNNYIDNRELEAMESNKDNTGGGLGGGEY